MKVEVTMERYGMSIELEAEDLEDAITLTRFGLNGIKKIHFKDTFVSNNNTIRTSICIATRQKTETIIKT